MLKKKVISIMGIGVILSSLFCACGNKKLVSEKIKNVNLLTGKEEFKVEEKVDNKTEQKTNVHYLDLQDNYTIIVDKKTGVQYIRCSNGSFIPRLDKDYHLYIEKDQQENTQIDNSKK